MRITATEEYGLRCILQLAKLEAGKPLPASAIAEKEGISLEYASKMMHLFRRSDLVESVRGLKGGFRLAKPASEISLFDVFESLKPAGRSPSDGFCQQFSGDRDACVHIDECSVRPIWSVLLNYFDSILHKLTLDDLVHGEQFTRVRVERIPRLRVERTPKVQEGKT